MFSHFDIDKKVQIIIYEEEEECSRDDVGVVCNEAHNSGFIGLSIAVGLQIVITIYSTGLMVNKYEFSPILIQSNNLTFPLNNNNNKNK